MKIYEFLLLVVALCIVTAVGVIRTLSIHKNVEYLSIDAVCFLICLAFIWIVCWF